MVIPKRKHKNSNVYKVMSDTSGYVCKFTLDTVYAKAKALDICILYHPHIGEYVAEGTLLAYVWDNNSSNNNSDDDENEDNDGNVNVSCFS